MMLTDEQKPKVLLIYSEMGICTLCGHWRGRFPLFYGVFSGGKGDSCEHCGCTSVEIRPGRPFGPRSRYWANLVRFFNHYVLDLSYENWWEYRDMVKTEPPLPTYEETWNEYA